MLLFYFLYLLFLESSFLPVAYLTVANLARLGIWAYCWFSVRSHYLVRVLSLCWITKGHTQSTHQLKDCYSLNWHWTHTVPKFGLQSSWITGACYYFVTLVHLHSAFFIQLNTFLNLCLKLCFRLFFYTSLLTEAFLLNVFR